MEPVLSLQPSSCTRSSSASVRRRGAPRNWGCGNGIAVQSPNGRPGSGDPPSQLTAWSESAETTIGLERSSIGKRDRGNRLAVEAHGRGDDEPFRRTVERNRQGSPRSEDVRQLGDHEGRRSDEIWCFGDCGEKLRELLSAELRAGGYRCTLTLRVAQVAASDQHFPSASDRARLRHQRRARETGGIPAERVRLLPNT